MKRPYKYAVLHDPEELVTTDDMYDFKSSWSEPVDSGEWIAEDAAEDYHRNHDGWEDSWPLTFEIRTVEGDLVGKYKIDRYAEPAFSATEIK